MFATSGPTTGISWNPRLAWHDAITEMHQLAISPFTGFESQLPLEPRGADDPPVVSPTSRDRRSASADIHTETFVDEIGTAMSMRLEALQKVVAAATNRRRRHLLAQGFLECAAHLRELDVLGSQRIDLACQPRCLIANLLKDSVGPLGLFYMVFEGASQTGAPIARPTERPAS